MSVTINTLGDFQQVGNGSGIGTYRTLSMEDVMDQARFTASNDTWQAEIIDDECNNYIEEYE